MPWTNEHLQWLEYVDTKQTADNRDIDIYQFNYDLNDEEILSNWARHFRNHYCLDELIDDLRDGTNLSREEYLKNLKFPEEGRNGAKTRSGDFGEILISDFIEYNLNFWVPRTRFSDRANRNNPTQGVDVIGFKSDDYSQNLINDELIIFEVKCKLTGNQAFLTKTRMETAIFDSAKDFNVRKAESLNGLKQIYLKERNTENANKIKRFQNPTDRPYIELSGASSLILDGAYDETKISEIDASNHPNLRNLKLILIKGENLMPLVHTLYERAANEAEQF
ncbi:Hachiman antiphage defense system protein HamA [Aliarcobacter butzleri]|uniref:Hachiman antiphage defense system protein HamA n=1 Tax=Aliarcobacter butzleri TaxID=28197 RepID=UPI00344EBA6D